MTCQNITPIHVKNHILRAKSSFLFAFEGSKSISELAETNIVDPDPHNVYTKRKEHRTACEDNISAAANAPQPNYPSDGWSGDIKRTSFFTRAEMNNHIAKSGKNIDSSKSHSVSTSVRKATTFLNHDEYF